MATLDTLLSMLESIEDDLTELTDDDIAELLGDLRGKVDSIRAVMTRMESREEMLANDIKLLTGKKKAMTNARERFKDYLVRTMDGHGFQKLPGNKWDVALRTRKKYSAIRPATEADYKGLRGWVVKQKVEYTFDHQKLTAAYKSRPEDFADLMLEGQSQFIQFNVHK